MYHASYIQEPCQESLAMKAGIPGLLFCLCVYALTVQCQSHWHWLYPFPPFICLMECWYCSCTSLLERFWQSRCWSVACQQVHQPIHLRLQVCIYADFCFVISPCKMSECNRCWLWQLCIAVALHWSCNVTTHHSLPQVLPQEAQQVLSWRSHGT